MGNFAIRRASKNASTVMGKKTSNENLVSKASPTEAPRARARGVLGHSNQRHNASVASRNMPTNAMSVVARAPCAMKAGSVPVSATATSPDKGRRLPCANPHAEASAMRKKGSVPQRAQARFCSKPAPA